MSTVSQDKKIHRASYNSRLSWEKVLVIILFALILGLAVLTINYNWHQTGKNEQADIFKTIKDKLSNVQVK